MDVFNHDLNVKNNHDVDILPTQRSFIIFHFDENAVRRTYALSLLSAIVKLACYSIKDILHVLLSINMFALSRASVRSVSRSALRR
jgi:hypothetical protein